MKKTPGIIDADDAVLLLIDPQSGLFQLVKDMELTDLRANITALAKTAYLAKIPTFTTASVPDGPNGPLIPEVHAANPDAVYIPRTGQINAWDNPLWVEAIRKTGKKTLIMAGTVTSVCLALPALSAIHEGYRVFAVFDASGNWSKMGTEITLARLTQAGVVPVDTFAVMCEVMGTWNRPDASQFGQIMAEHVMPHYRLLFESFDKAQSVAKNGPETILDKAG
ncbi:isochorismatase family protein [Oxalobacter sp. OttesenSCG-928-P03]|nr:isochorismatase family protein [Oxalobacter sp. OttesenSCG-928-P03]